MYLDGIFDNSQIDVSEPRALYVQPFAYSNGFGRGERLRAICSWLEPLIGRNLMPHVPRRKRNITRTFRPELTVKYYTMCTCVSRIFVASHLHPLHR